MLHFAQGRFPYITAFQIDTEINGHFPWPAVLFRTGQKGLHGPFIASDQLEGDEVPSRLQQDGLFRPDVVTVRIVRDGDIELNGLVQHIDKRLLPFPDAVDIDGRYAAGDMVAVYREKDILHEERFPGLGDRAQFPAGGTAFPE